MIRCSTASALSRTYVPAYRWQTRRVLATQESTEQLPLCLSPTSYWCWRSPIRRTKGAVHIWRAVKYMPKTTECFVHTSSTCTLISDSKTSPAPDSLNSFSLPHLQSKNQAIKQSSNQQPIPLLNTTMFASATAFVAISLITLAASMPYLPSYEMAPGTVSVAPHAFQTPAPAPSLVSPYVPTPITIDLLAGERAAMGY
jgi:hypothetical protein